MQNPLPLLAQTAASPSLGTVDMILFFVAVIGVIGFGIWQAERQAPGASEGGAAGYFLAGRGLTWWLVGFSLIAANISTEQFVGMSGKSADWLGMAIASYEWMAAITLVVVAFVFLPKLLRCGIYTIPEFLEYRYGVFSRTVMAVATLVILVGVPTASVIFSGAKVVAVFFAGHSVLGLDLGNLTTGCWIIGLSAAVYVFIGGLKACAWTDLIWGASLIIGGAIVMFLAFDKLRDADPAELIQTKVANSRATVEDLGNAGAWERFKLLNDGRDGEAVAVTGENLSGGKMHMIRPKDDPEIPWTALIIGLWIPNFFYWGLNQYIVQRTLGSRSLAEGQKGIVFAAALKMLIPFIVVIPGILCFNLFSKDLREEAVKRNAATLEQLASPGGAAVVYPFSENFALTDPAQAAMVVAHNARVLGAAVPDGLDGAPAMFAANEELIAGLPGVNGNSARGQRITSGTKLIGYDYDAAFPTLLRNLLKPGLAWFVLALACLDAQFRIDHRDHGHCIQDRPQAASPGDVAIRAGRQRPDLRGGFRAGCLPDRPGSRRSEIRRHFHLHSGVPGFHQSGHPRGLPVRFPGGQDAAIHGLGGHPAQCRALWRTQVVDRSRHAVSQPHGGLLRYRLRHLGHRDHPASAQAAGCDAPNRPYLSGIIEVREGLGHCGGGGDLDALLDVLVMISGGRNHESLRVDARRRKHC
jgi:SSS family solute:Na+ symporter